MTIRELLHRDVAIRVWLAVVHEDTTEAAIMAGVEPTYTPEQVENAAYYVDCLIADPWHPPPLRLQPTQPEGVEPDPWLASNLAARAVIIALHLHEEPATIPLPGGTTMRLP